MRGSLRDDLRKAALVEEELAEEIDGAPVLPVGIKSRGCHRILERRPDAAQRIRQQIVRKTHHLLSSLSLLCAWERGTSERAKTGG